MEENIRDKIFSLGDERYKQFHSGLCPGINNIIGVRVPELRTLAKKIVKEDGKEYLENAKDDYYEEILLQGMCIGLVKMDVKERLEYLKIFIPKIDNWAVCDITCAGLKFTNKNIEEVWKFIKQYIKSDKEFEIRFAVVMMLDYYIIKEYIQEVLSIVNNIQHDGYYVKMAVAWLISVAYIKFPDETKVFLNNNKLDDFTYNKALQKAIESYRVSNKEKDYLRKIKRK